jgi:hypothetical protein
MVIHKSINYFQSKFMSNALLFKVVLLTLFAAAVQSASAIAPINDNIANATVLSGASGQATATNVGATKEPGEPAHGQNRGGASIWFKWVATGSGALTLEASGINTTLAVYRAGSPAIDNLTLVAESDDTSYQNGGGVYSTVLLGTVTNATYYIAVDGHYDEATGNLATGTITLDYQLGNTAPTDNLSDAALDFRGLALGSRILSVTTTNIGASKEVGEPNHGGNPGGKSVWFHWWNDTSTPRSFTFSLKTRGVSNYTGSVTALFAIYTGTSVDALTPVASTITDRVARLTIIAQPNTKYFIAIDGYDSGSGSAVGNFTLSYGATKSKKYPDFDADGKTDISVYRPTTGVWYSLDSSSNQFRAFQWGLNGDKPMFNEWEGDGKPDYAVYRPDTQVWYINKSLVGFNAFNWGLDTDIPLTLNQNTQGSVLAYSAVFRPSTGTWWIFNPGANPIVFQFGLNGDIPVTGDFDGDGTDEAAVFRPSDGTWYIGNPFTGAFVNAIQFGQSGDIPVPADYDGDGFVDIAIYRPSTGTWWFRNRLTGAQTAAHWGISTDKPQPADYDNDGKADLAVFRSGVWWILQSSTGTAKVVSFGLPGDIPMSAPAN